MIGNHGLRKTGSRTAAALAILGFYVALLHAAVWAQMLGTPGVQLPTPLTSGAVGTSPSASSIMQGMQASQNPLLGSVPQGQPTPGVLRLTPLDAIDRGLKYNLGLLLSQQATEAARGARYRALSDLLPRLTAQTQEVVQQINLAQFGFTFGGFPQIIGPFSFFDVRALATSPLFDMHALDVFRARVRDIQAAEFNYQNARDLVVLVVGGAYMQALAGSARIESVQAQVNTASALYGQAQDLKGAGVVAAIDVLRSQVEMQVQQQRLLAAQNDFAKQKLVLARLIGLPVSQEFTLAEDIPYAPAPPITLEQALERALTNRSDYASARELVRSAELERKAAAAESLPTVHVDADYGDLGHTPANSHGTFSTAAALKIPIFQGGKVRGDTMAADALLQQRQSELADLQGKIEFDVRTAFLDLNSAGDQLKVAQSSQALAREALAQARDRFAAGVTNNIEVIQAQEAVAVTDDNYISSLFAFNVAKLSLARAVGTAEKSVKDFLGGNR